MVPSIQQQTQNFEEEEDSVMDWTTYCLISKIKYNDDKRLKLINI
jgi:hypothetical protein